MNETKHVSGAGVQQPSALGDRQLAHQVVALHLDARGNAGWQLLEQTRQWQDSSTWWEAAMPGFFDERVMVGNRGSGRAVAQLVPAEMTRFDQRSHLVGTFSESGVMQQVEHDGAARRLGKTDGVSRGVRCGPRHVFDADAQVDRSAPLDEAMEIVLGSVERVVTTKIGDDEYTPGPESRRHVGEDSDVGSRTDAMDFDIVKDESGVGEGCRHPADTGGVHSVIVRQAQPDAVEANLRRGLDQLDRRDIEHRSCGQVEGAVEHSATLGADMARTSDGAR